MNGVDRIAAVSTSWPGLWTRMDCASCPAARAACAQCVMTALWELPEVVPGPGWDDPLPLDSVEAAAVARLLDAGLISVVEAESVGARVEPTLSAFAG